MEQQVKLLFSGAAQTSVVGTVSGGLSSSRGFGKRRIVNGDRHGVEVGERRHDTAITEEILKLIKPGSSRNIVEVSKKALGMVDG